VLLYQLTAFANYKITQLPNYKIGTHGKYIYSQQRRTQKSETHRAKEARNRASIEAPRVRPRIEEKQSEETGTRTGETVRFTHPSKTAKGGAPALN
jgi:hypothetical protein